MLIAQEVAVIAVIRFSPMVTFLLGSPSLLVQGVEANLAVTQILKSKKDMSGVGKEKSSHYGPGMECQVQLLFQLFLRSCSR